MIRVLTLSIGMFALGLDGYVLSGLLPSIAEDFSAPIVISAQIVTAFAAAYALLAPLLSFMTVALDRRVVLIGGLVVFALANIGSVLAPTLGTLMMMRVVAGAAAGIYAPAAAATAAGLVSTRSRGRALALVVGGLTTSTAFGVPLALLLADHFGWRAVLMTVAAISMMAATGIAIWVPAPKAPTRSVPALRCVLSNRAVLGRIGVMLFAAMANLGLFTYLTSVLTELSGVLTKDLHKYFFLWGIAGLFGNAIAGRLLDRGISASRMLACSLLALAIALAIFPLFSTTPEGAGFILIVWGMAVWSLQAPIQHQLAGILPEHASTTMALLASSICLGSAIGSGLGGIVLSHSVALLGPAAAACVLVSLTIHLRSRPSPIPNKEFSSVPATTP